MVAGQATITQPTSTSQVVNQTTHKAIIDWKSFSIASGEKVRFNQPSNDLGHAQPRDRLRPVLHPRRDVVEREDLPASTRTASSSAPTRAWTSAGWSRRRCRLANSDFLAGRYSLTSVEPGAPAQRGEVRNEGTISSPGGTVALAGAERQQHRHDRRQRRAGRHGRGQRGLRRRRRRRPAVLPGQRHRGEEPARAARPASRPTAARSRCGRRRAALSPTPC